MRTHATHRVVLNAPIFKEMLVGDPQGKEPTGKKTLSFSVPVDGRLEPHMLKVSFSVYPQEPCANIHETDGQRRRRQDFVARGEGIAEDNVIICVECFSFVNSLLIANIRSLYQLLCFILFRPDSHFSPRIHMALVKCILKEFRSRLIQADWSPLFCSFVSNA